MKLATLSTPADTFYFNFDLRDLKTKLNDGDTAILEISLFRYYIGLYDGGIQWGKVDEEGYLWLIYSPGHDYKLTITQFLTLFFFIMSLSVALSLLAQGNNGDQILQILDTLVADIEQENINSCAEVFEVWLMPTVCPLVDSGGHQC